MTGPLALDAARAQNTPFELVFMDWQMPGMNGIETVKKIRAQGHTSQKIIMVTAYGREEILQVAKEIGVDAFLIKPVNPSLLFDTVMNLFGHEASDATVSQWQTPNHTEALAKIAGARILLVEDNAINQQVAREILEGVGMVVEIAKNGLEAVHKVAKFQFDAVLMDLQMPEMDGYEATQRIRNEWRFQKLPIIAMTAHAMAGEREKCVAVGMNDHLGKPIEIEKLYAALLQWIELDNCRAPTKIGPRQSAPTAGGRDILPDVLPGIDIQSGILRIRGNRQLFKSLLIEFYRDFVNIAEQLRTALKNPGQKDIATARQLAHTIKGLAGNLSAQALHQVAHNLEIGIREDRQNDWPGLLDHFEIALQQVLESISTLQPQENEAVESTESTAVDIDKVRPLLIELDHLLEENDMDAEKCLSVLSDSLEGCGFRKELQSIEQHIDNLDSNGARALLAALARQLIIGMEHDNA